MATKSTPASEHPQPDPIKLQEERDKLQTQLDDMANDRPYTHAVGSAFQEHLDKLNELVNRYGMTNPVTLESYQFKADKDNFPVLLKLLHECVHGTIYPHADALRKDVEAAKKELDKVVKNIFEANKDQTDGKVPSSYMTHVKWMKSSLDAMVRIAQEQDDTKSELEDQIAEIDKKLASHPRSLAAHLLFAARKDPSLKDAVVSILRG